MANLTPNAQFDEVYQIETTDSVIGGPGGIANQQAQQLLNRTEYLKGQLDASGNALADHVAADDPHSQYATGYDLENHAGDADDPHAAAGYVKDSEIDGLLNPAESALIDAATITWNCSTQSEAKVTIGGNRTLAAPSGLVAGRYASLRVAQDATGARVLSFASNYKGVADISLSTDANAVDWLLFRAVDAVNCELVGYRTNVGA